MTTPFSQSVVIISLNIMTIRRVWNPDQNPHFTARRKPKRYNSFASCPAGEENDRCELMLRRLQS